MKRCLLIIMAFCLFISNAKAAEDYAPGAKSAILIDNATGKVLFEKTQMKN